MWIEVDTRVSKQCLVWEGSSSRAPSEELEPFWLLFPLKNSSKRLLLLNCLEGSFGGAGARAGEETY
jgi:hypothetical protein